MRFPKVSKQHVAAIASFDPQASNPVKIERKQLDIISTPGEP
jgi:hypothetical protein